MRVRRFADIQNRRDVDPDHIQLIRNMGGVCALRARRLDGTCRLRSSAHRLAGFIDGSHDAGIVGDFERQHDRPVVDILCIINLGPQPGKFGLQPDKQILKSTATGQKNGQSDQRKETNERRTSNVQH